jgi:hypothetical protein
MEERRRRLPIPPPAAQRSGGTQGRGLTAIVGPREVKQIKYELRINLKTAKALGIEARGAARRRRPGGRMMKGR